MQHLSPEILIKAYSIGVFPMAEGRDDERVFFVSPERRGVLPLQAMTISRSLRRAVRQRRYSITLNHDFAAVIEGCRAPTAERKDSWINDRIRQLYLALHRLGFAHSVEAWAKNDEQANEDGADADWENTNAENAPAKRLVGGLYGVALGGAFFGESMFSRADNASKIALVHLVARLRAGGFTLLDTQFTTPHLCSLGAIEISRHAFEKQLETALASRAMLPQQKDDWPWVEALLEDSRSR